MLILLKLIYPDLSASIALVVDGSWESNSRKDPETLSQLLEVADVANTPFEQKRVQEIKKLNKQVPDTLSKLWIE